VQLPGARVDDGCANAGHRSQARALLSGSWFRESPGFEEGSARVKPIRSVREILTAMGLAAVTAATPGCIFVGNPAPLPHDGGPSSDAGGAHDSETDDAGTDAGADAAIPTDAATDAAALDAATGLDAAADSGATPDDAG
jgi:hypothetical protein